MLESGWKLLVVQGAVAIVFGIIAMVWPLGTAVSLVVIWGIFALADGVALMFAAFDAEGGARKTLYVVMSIISIIAGVVAVLQPVYSGVLLTWAIGIWLIIRAGFEAYDAFVVEQGNKRWLRFGGALLLLVAGIVFVSNPGRSALALAVWLGLFAVLAGVFLLAAGLMARSALNRARAGGAAPA